MMHMMGEISGEATGGGGYYPMMMGFPGMGSGWLWLGGIFWLATWVLVIAALVALIRWLWKKGE